MKKNSKVIWKVFDMTDGTYRFAFTEKQRTYYEREIKRCGHIYKTITTPRGVGSGLPVPDDPPTEVVDAAESDFIITELRKLVNRMGGDDGRK